MPKYTIWIRDEDDDQWQKIMSRSDWLHDRLRQDKLTDKYMEAMRKTDTTRSELGLPPLPDTTIVPPEEVA